MVDRTATRSQGVLCKWFNNNPDTGFHGGYGFIAPFGSASDQVFVHSTQLLAIEDLSLGTQLEYSVTGPTAKSSRGRRATYVVRLGGPSRAQKRDRGDVPAEAMRASLDAELDELRGQRKQRVTPSEAAPDGHAHTTMSELRSLDEIVAGKKGAKAERPLLGLAPAPASSSKVSMELRLAPKGSIEELAQQIIRNFGSCVALNKLCIELYKQRPSCKGQLQGRVRGTRGTVRAWFEDRPLLFTVENAQGNPVVSLVEALQSSSAGAAEASVAKRIRTELASSVATGAASAKCSRTELAVGPPKPLASGSVQVDGNGTGGPFGKDAKEKRRERFGVGSGSTSLTPSDREEMWTSPGASAGAILERRFDTDGHGGQKLYTKAEFVKLYGSTAQWDAARQPPPRGAGAILERRFDTDGHGGQKLYTKAEFVKLYGGTVEWQQAPREHASKRAPREWQQHLQQAGTGLVSGSCGSSRQAPSSQPSQELQSAARPLSKREGKRPVPGESAVSAKRRLAAIGLVVMEFALQAMGVSASKCKLIADKSGCRLGHAMPGTLCSMQGNALQLRHAAELLLKNAKGAKGGAPAELQVAADDSQADWVLGKSGGTLQQLKQKHAGVSFQIWRPGGSESIRMIALRGEPSQIREAVHDIAELWLGQGTAPLRGEQGGSAGNSLSSAAGPPRSSAGASAGPSEVRVRSLEQIRAEKREGEGASGQASAVTPKLPSTRKPTAATAPTALHGAPPEQPPVLPPAAASAVSCAIDVNPQDDDGVEVEQPSSPSGAPSSRTLLPADVMAGVGLAGDEARAMHEELLREREEIQRLKEQIKELQQPKEQAPLPDEQRERAVDNLREVIQGKREHAGKGAKEPWKIKLPREPVVCAFTEDDIRKSLSITEGVVKVNGVERAVLWGGRVPEDISRAQILSVEERVGGRLEVQGAETLRENPMAGLVAEMLSYMGKVKGQGGLWRPTTVIFESEDGKDEGGLTEEMYVAFWKGVVSTELGLFECAEDLEMPAFLPKPGACIHSIEMVGLMLCKSLITGHPTGPGLCRFVFDFLLEAEGKQSRAFAKESKPIMDQAETAIVSLSHFDVQCASMYRGYLREQETGELRTGESIATHFGGMALGELIKLDGGHELINEAVTVDSLPRAIVASCRWVLCESRLAQLQALRKGFTSYVDVTTALRLLPSPDVMLVVQGRHDPLSAEQLIGEIEWPDTAEAQLKEGDEISVAEMAEFPSDSTTCELLRSILRDEQCFPQQRLQDFLHWVAGRRVLPEGGLASTKEGKITLRCRYAESEDRWWTDALPEESWPLPVSSTCSVEITLPNYTNRDVLAKKLLTAIEETKDRNYLK